MFKRRNFIKRGLLGAAGLSLAGVACETAENTATAQEEQGHQNPNSKAGTPAVICTWPHLPATEEAMRVIGENGRAVDAVEMGVRVVEADPTAGPFSPEQEPGSTHVSVGVAFDGVCRCPIGSAATGARSLCDPRPATPK